MALTAEQVEVRTTGMGASETPIAAGLSRFATPIDLWLRKTGRETGDNESPAAEVGFALEPAILDLYCRRTGHTAERPIATYRHPEHDWVLASPDAITTAGHLVEIKCVGHRMSGDWDEGPPSYVLAQITQQCAVLGRSRCDVAALHGTDLRIYEVAFDADLWAALFEIAEEFWVKYVQGDTPPPAAANESRREYLSKKFRGGRDDLIEIADEHVVQLVERYRDAKAATAAAESALEAVECDLKELIGDTSGIFGPWGRAAWTTQQGSTSWKAVAAALAPFGVVPPELLEQHRSKPFRKFQVYGPKKGK